MPGWPPRLNIRVFRVGGEDGAKPRVFALFDVELELVHALEIEANAAFAAVDLERVVVFTTGGKARGFDAAERAVGEADVRVSGVVDVDDAGALAVRQRALADERLEKTAHLGDLAHQVAAQIERVRADVTERARAGARLLEPPDPREFRIDDPILKITAPEMVNRADAPFADVFFGQADGGATAVVVTEHVQNPGALDRR